MKLVVQIPCANEEQSIDVVLKTIPKKIPGIDEITVVIIDDGCTDNTIAIAKELGIKHFVVHKQRMGLARAFHDGADKALALGADILVSTDGDNQYPQASIPELVAPILAGQADIVIGDRQVQTIAHFSAVKKLFQRIGTKVVSLAAGTYIHDAPSGFRAYSREALLRLNIVTQFSYTMETIIQAGNKHIPIVSVPIVTNPKTRESRLFKNIWQHMFRSGQAIIKCFIMYKPHLIFIPAGIFFLIAGLIPFVRYLILTIGNHPGSHIQSLLLGLIFLTGAIMSIALAVISDLVKTNRTLQEDALERIKRIEFPKK